MSASVAPDAREEAPRDQGESAFTGILRSLFAANTDVLAVAFVDAEGETIDYCSALEPFEAKVNAAHLRVVVDELQGRLLKLEQGDLRRLVLSASERDLYSVLVSEDYTLITITRAGGADRLLFLAVEVAVEALRREAGLDEGHWASLEHRVEVELRRSSGWEYAPEAFRMGSERVRLRGVLGRFEPSEAVRCFRVQGESGEEFTLGHHVWSDRWALVSERDIPFRTSVWPSSKKPGSP